MRYRRIDADHKSDQNHGVEPRSDELDVRDRKAMAAYAISVAEEFGAVNGLLGVAGQSQYCASKFAVRGFTEALRQEILIAGHKVTVTCVHPGNIKTDIARNAGLAGDRDQATHVEFFEKYLARTSAEQAADDIVDGILKQRARVLIGHDARALDTLIRILGPHYQFFFAKVLKRINARLTLPR